MKPIRVSISSGKIVKNFMSGAVIIALGWELLSLHRRLDKIELLDTRVEEELNEYFHYADEQKKKSEIIKNIKKDTEP